MKIKKVKARDRVAMPETKWSFLLGIDNWAEITACRDGLQVNDRGIIPWTEILQAYDAKADLPPASLD